MCPLARRPATPATRARLPAASRPSPWAPTAIGARRQHDLGLHLLPYGKLSRRHGEALDHVATNPANQNCSASGCHSSFTSFSGTTYTHTSASSGQCYTCHGTGTGGAMKEVANHVPTGSASCDTCHTSTATGGFATFTMGSTGHTTLGVSMTSDCTSCHIGSYLGVTVKPSTHVATNPANQNCSASGCHSSFASFSGATYTHTTASSGQCYTCHSTGSGGAMKQVANHVPTGTATCDACHKSTAVGGFATFAMGSSGHTALGVTIPRLASPATGKLPGCRGEAIGARDDNGGPELLGFRTPQQLHELRRHHLQPLRRDLGHLL